MIYSLSSVISQESMWVGGHFSFFIIVNFDPIHVYWDNKLVCQLGHRACTCNIYILLFCTTELVVVVEISEYFMISLLKTLCKYTMDSTGIMDQGIAILIDSHTGILQ